MVEYFLKKDVEMRQQARRKARLEAQAKVSISISKFFVLFFAKKCNFKVTFWIVAIFG